MKCPHCNRDIRNAVILQAAGAIVAKRRRRAGHSLTSEQAQEMQPRSVAARMANASRPD